MMPAKSCRFRTKQAARSVLLVSLIACTGLTAAPTITATKDDNLPAATKKPGGSTVTYKTTITNTGDATATGVTFTDPNVANAPLTSVVKVTPIAQDDAFATVGNTRLVVNAAGGLLANDHDPDSTVFTVKAGSISRVSATGTANATPGTLTVAPDGGFIYTPGIGATGSERWQYTIKDGDNLDCVVPGYVDISITGRVWYVQAGASGVKSGRSHDPFDSPAAASTAANASTDFIYVLSSGTALNGAFTLEDGQKLLGQGVNLTVSALTPFTAGAAPTLTNTGGNTITLGGSNTISGLVLGNRSGAAILGSAFGTLTVTSDVIINGTGQALNLATGTLSATFASISASTATSGISLTTIGGNLTVNGGLLDAISGDDFAINGGTLAVTYSGRITNTAGRSIHISNKTSSGDVTFNGRITDSGSGILLDNNDGATITLKSLGMNTGTNNAFSAVNGGTVVVTNGATDGVNNDGDGQTDEADEANTITTSSGTALSVANTNIGPAGLSFLSISANGGSNGIVLNNTGANSGLNVTGTGTTDGSGGTIQSTSTRGASFIGARNITLKNMNFTNATTADNPGAPTGLSLGANTADNAAIHLDNVFNVTLDNLNINGSAEQGINGRNVTNFTLKDSVLTALGGGPDEDGIHFFNMLGTCAITNTSISGSGDDNINIQNNTNLALPAGMTATGTISITGGNANTGVLGSGYLFGIRGTSNTTVTISGVTSDNNFSGGIVADCYDTATMAIEVSGSTITNNNDGIQVSANNGTATFNIHNNSPFTGQDFACITLLKAASSTFGTLSGTINANTFTVPNGRPTDAISVFNAGGGALNAAITNNTINYGGTQRAILIQAGQDGNGSIRAQVTGNTIDVQLDGTGDAVAGMLVQASITSPTGDGASVDAKIGGAGGLKNTFIHSLNGTMAGGDIRLRQRNNGTFNLDGYGGGATDTAAVISYLTGRNTVVSPVTATAQSTGFTGLATPAVPLLFATGEPEEFNFGAPDSLPSAVAWTEAVRQESEITPPAKTLETTRDNPTPSSVLPLDQSQLDSLVSAARAQWRKSGLNAEQSAALDTVTFEVADLPGWYLGEATGQSVRIDNNAGGNGWFIDPTPLEDEEFSSNLEKTAATGRVDLLTTVMHEMGHSLGLCDSYAKDQRDSVMYGFLTKSERRLPKAGEAAGAVPHTHTTPHFLGSPVDIANLPPGKSVVITYTVTVADPFPLGVRSLTSQGTVSGGNFSNVLTDDAQSDPGDPLLPGVADPTVTLLDRPDTTVSSINRSGSSPTSASPVTWEIIFANPISGLAAGNFSLVNTGPGGTPAISAVTAVGGAPTTNWTISATTGTGQGTLGLNLLNDSAITHDVTALPFTGEAYTIDHVQPTVAINQTAGQVDPAKIGPVNFTVAFSEPMNGFATGDVTLGGTAGATTGTVTEIAPNNGTTYTVAVTGMTSPGTVTASLAASVATDLAGNNNAASTSTDNAVAFDNVAPTVAMTSTTGNPATNAAIPVTVQFSEPVTGFIVADISGGNATVANFIAVDGDTYTFTLTPSGPGVIATADISAAVAQDAAGNDNAAAAQFSRTVVDAVSVATINAGDNDADESGNTGTFTFTRGSTAGELTADFQLDPSSTSTATDDFTLTGSASFNTSSGAGTVTFPNGQATVTVTLNATAETLNAAEAAETVRLNVVAQAGAYVTGSSANATVTIAANGFIVTATTDSGEGSLRQAVTNANAIAGTNAITFEGGTFTDGLPDIISLSGGQITISSDLTVSGPGANWLTVRNTAAASTTSRVLLVSAGTSTVRGMKISGGNVNGASGGGIRISPGTLTLIDCAVVDNSVSEFGGGIRNNNGTLKVVNSTISGNIAAGNGAAGGIDSSGSLTVINSTISGNSATNAASGSNSGGIYADGPTTIRNSTVTNNSNSGTGTSGILQASGTLTVANSIIAGNQNNGTKPDVEGTFVSSGYNLIGNVGTSTGFTGAGDLKGTGVALLDPMLASLADNGGTTQTHALLSGSPAFNAGNASLLPADTTDMDADSDTTEAIPFDQRGTGFVRSVGVIDIGSFEVEKFVTIVADAASKAEGTGSGNTPFTFTVTRTGGTTGVVTMDYVVTGTANAADFGGTLPSGQFIIPDGQASTILTVDVSKDATVEPSESFTVMLTKASGGYAIGGATASSTVTNDDTATLAVVKVNDGAETDAPTNALFRITQSATSSTDTVVSFTHGGTATTGSDFTALPGTATILAGSATADIPVAVLNDAIVEGTETVGITLTAITASHPNVTLGATLNASLDVTDNDAANVVIAKITDGAETNTPVNGLFRVTQSAISSSNTILTYTVGGTASSGNDYTARSGSVTVVAGQTTADIVLPVLNDAIVESIETVAITLTAFSAGDTDISLGAVFTATADITDNDTATVAIIPQSVGFESNSPANGIFRIIQSGVSSINTVVNLSVSGTATSGVDYTALPANVTIVAGQTSLDVFLPVLNDNFIEPTETVIATLGSLGTHSSGVSIIAGPGNSATVNIIDSDIAASIAVNSGSGQSATVNTAFASPLVAIVRDSGGVAMGGASVTFTANGVTANGTFSSSATVITTASGLATAPTFTANTVSGSYTVTAVATGVGLPATFSLTNDAAAASRIFVNGSPVLHARDPYNLYVTVLDPFDNVATSYAGTVHFTSSDPAAILPPDTTLTSGFDIVSLRLSTKGNQTVTATDTANPSITAEKAIFVFPMADLSITLNDSPDPVNAAGNLNYTIILTNNGPSAVDLPSVSMPLPASTTFVSAAAPGVWITSSPAVGGTGTVSFSDVSLASGGTATFTVVAKVDLNVVNDSTLTATATASSDTPESVSGNNSATTTTTAKSGADLQITLGAAPEPVVAGTSLTYTLQVANNGPLDAENVSIGDALPAGTSFVTLSTPPGWTSTTPAVGSSGSLTITRPILANGENATFTLVVGVNPDVTNGTVLSNTATASSTVTDIVPGNNAATTTSSVTTRSDLEITLTGTPAIAPKGTNVFYKITLTNGGSSSSSSPMVSFPIPSNMTFVNAVTPVEIANPDSWSASTPAVGATGTVSFSKSSLANGATAAFTVIARVDANAPNGTVLSATATASATTVDPVPANNSTSSQSVVGTVSLVTYQPVTTGTTVNSQTGLFDVTIYVTNTTPYPINGFRLHVDYNAYKAAHPSLRLYNASSTLGAFDVYINHLFPVAVDGVVPVKLSFYTNNRRFPSPFQPGLTVESLGTSQIAGIIGNSVQPTIARSPDQSVRLEFPALTGKWYRVRYSPDLVHWFTSEIPVQATGNLMQWIDNGPPFTNIAPASATSRFYLINQIGAP